MHETQTGHERPQPAKSLPALDKLMSYEEAAEYVSKRWRPTSHRTVRRWVAQGRLRVLRPNGHNVAIEAAAIEDMLLSNQKGARKR